MVTHDIEEAVFLSDRIVVMNNGPAATIREIEEVHLPRPRNKKDTVNLPEYKIIRERLLSLLVDKIALDEGEFAERIDEGDVNGTRFRAQLAAQRDQGTEGRVDFPYRQNLWIGQQGVAQPSLVASRGFSKRQPLGSPNRCTFALE
jgi:hypothetical protein